MLKNNGWKISKYDDEEWSVGTREVVQTHLGTGENRKH